MLLAENNFITHKGWHLFRMFWLLLYSICWRTARIFFFNSELLVSQWLDFRMVSVFVGLDGRGLAWVGNTHTRNEDREESQGYWIPTANPITRFAALEWPFRLLQIDWAKRRRRKTPNVKHKRRNAYNWRKDFY